MGCHSSLESRLSHLHLSDQNSAAVDVEDLAGDEAGPGGTEKHNWPGDLFGLGGAAERNKVQRFLGRDWIAQGSSGHFRPHPSWSHAVAQDPLGRELGREALGEGEQSALAGGVVGVEGLAALCGGGGDEDDVAAARSLRSGCRSICTVADWTRPKTLERLMPSVVDHCDARIVAMGWSCGGQMPWLTMRMSRRSKTLMAAATRAWPSSMVARSCRMARQWASPPHSATSAVAWSAAER